MAYRDDLAALAARRAALETEVTAKTRELAEASQMLAEATARTRLPVLDNLRVASPCKADWAQMSGDERARHCGACDKQVFNLSGMTRDEAQALIIERAGDLCARYYQRSDGTILLADCEIGVGRKRRIAVIAGAAALVAGAGVAVANLLPDRAQSDPFSEHRIRGAEESIRANISPAIVGEPAPPPEPVVVEEQPLPSHHDDDDVREMLGKLSEPME